MSAYLCCGVAGTELDEEERRTLAELAPGGVILFARNVVDRQQLAALVASLHALPGRPFVAVDLEGGRVNRLRALVGELPGAAQAACGGEAAVAALGRAAGAVCAHFGIDVDLAPVLDVAHEGGWLAGEGRCLGGEPAAAARLAAVFAAAVEAYGVSVCLKHYPGLGSGGVDSHRDLPLLADEVVEEEPIFRALAGGARAVMVAHALAPSLGEGVAPASLSRRLVARLRQAHAGPVLADDLEMGALDRYGTLPERAAAALAAGCDQVLVCNALGARAAVVAHIERWRCRDGGLARELEEGARRIARFARRPLVPVAWEEVVHRLAEARRLACPAG